MARKRKGAKRPSIGARLGRAKGQKRGLFGSRVGNLVNPPPRLILRPGIPDRAKKALESESESAPANVGQKEVAAVRSPLGPLADTPILTEEVMRKKRRTPAVDPVRKALDESKRVARIGESLYKKLRKQGLVGETGYAVINVARKEFVVGDTRKEAVKLYQKRFGSSPAYVRKLDGHTYAGNLYAL